MPRLLVLLVCAGIYVTAQSFSEVKIIPKNSTTTGSVDFYELDGLGRNRVGWRAPDSIASSFRLTLPPALPANSTKCPTVSTSGVMSYIDCSATTSPKDYNWTVSVGNLSAGAHTTTLTPCTLTASDTTWAFRVADGSSFEIVFPTGGNCIRGAASGTVQYTTVGSYTAASLSSSSGGLIDAIHSVAAGNSVAVNVPEGYYTVYADITTGSRVVTMNCAGPGAVLLAGATNLNMLNVASASSIRIFGCGFQNPNASASVTAILLNNPSGDTYGGLIQNNVISGMETGIKGVTWYSTDAVGNTISDCSNAAIWTANVNTGDAGAGDIRNNKLVCSVTCSYLMLHNGPGALVFADNKMNGATEQMHVEFMFGTASTADSGADTIITWVSGNKFRTSAVGRAIIVNGSSCTVDTYTSDTSLTCVGENLGTIAANNYYIGTTGQLVVSRNLFDYGTSTTKGLSWVGPISFANAKIDGNQFINYVTASGKGVEISSTGGSKIAIVDNSFDTDPALLSTIAVDLTGGTKYSVKVNNSSGFKTAFNYGGTTSAIESVGNQCTSAGTACVASSTGAKLLEATSFTQAQIAAFGSVGVGSRLYCSNCKTSGSGCASGGTGAIASFLNFTWRCFDGNTSINTVANCASAADPAVCSAAPVGAVAVAVGATTLVVNTTAVTANSLILLTFDSSLGAQLGAITCNTTQPNAYVSARTAGTSFTITVSAAPVTNRGCFSYTIVN